MNMNRTAATSEGILYGYDYFPLALAPFNYKKLVKKLKLLFPKLSDFNLVIVGSLSTSHLYIWVTACI